MKYRFWILLGAFALAFIGSQVMKHHIDSQTPNVVNEVINSHESNEQLETLLGGYKGYKAEYNTNDFKKDTLSFKVTFTGGRRDIVLLGVAKKTSSFKWQLMQVDTVFLDPAGD
jgi:hypothetical protein